MIYKYTEKNILCLLQSVGTLRHEQIIRFFSDSVPTSTIERMLYSLTKRREILFDETRKLYSFVAAPEVSNNVLRRRLDAFWVLANWGSTNIMQVALMQEPSQFLAFTHDNDAVDITVCDNVTDGRIAAQVRGYYRIKGVEDDINHIAVVYDPAVGEALKDYAFDSYCTFDRQTFKPHYVSLS